LVDTKSVKTKGVFSDMKMSPKVAAMSFMRDGLSKTVVKPPNLETFELKGDPSKRLAHFFATPSHY